MKVSAVVVLALAALCVASVAAEVEKDGSVYVLTTANFDDFLKESPYTFVKFYAPWCGHCKSLAPTWEELPKAVGEEIAIAKVDATEEQELGQRFGVRGFPTLKLFVGETVLDYNGDRSLQALSSWARKMTIEPAKKLATAEEVSEFQTTHPSKAAIIFFETEEQEKFGLDLARQHSGVEFGIAPADLNSGSAEVRLVKSYGDKASFSLSNLDKAAADDFVLSNAFPPVDEMSPVVWERLQSRAMPILVGIVSYEDAAAKDEFVGWLEKCHKESGVSASYGNSAQLGRAVEQFGGTGTLFPTVIGILPETWAKPEGSNIPTQFTWNEEKALTEESLVQWCKDIVQGQIELFKKSEPVPESQGDLKVLVTKNFEEEVAKADLTFIKFYAPWCGHCKAMKPAWDQLGEEYADSSSVLIGDVDCTVESKLCQDFGVNGYPTVKYWDPESPKEGSAYQGGRDYTSLEKHVKDKLEAKCDVNSPDQGCSDKEVSFLQKMKTKAVEEVKKQLERLEGLKNSKMTADLKKWVVQRYNILKQLVTGNKEEL